MPADFFVNASPGNNWTLSPDVVVQHVTATMHTCGIDRSERVLIPGPGVSYMPTQLYQAGIHNITMLDISEAAVDFQRTLFMSNGISAGDPLTGEGVVIGNGSVFDLATHALTQGVTYKLIIDESCLDYFLRTGGIRRAFDQVQRCLTSDGVLAIFSIHNGVWKRNVLTRDKWIAGFRNHATRRPSKSRPFIRQCRIQNIAEIVVKRAGHGGDFIHNLDLQNLKAVTNFPHDANNPA
eukprot:5265-Heterococcus_DN1.PRE.27